MRRLPLLLALPAILATTATAQAAPRFKPCSRVSIAVCAKVVVPLDRSGHVAGTTSLDVRRVRTPQPSRPPILALSGGPGQATTPFTDDIAYLFRAALRNRDLIVFDQRGTGRSGLIRCPTLEGLGARLFKVAGAAADCADTLGARRAFYTTPDSVEDIEAIRIALQVEQMTLYGVSYGTKVALAYAARYPQRVDRLVLDSIVDLDGPDPFALDILAALPRVLGELCAKRCEQVTRDPVGDLAALVSKLGGGLIRGPIIKSNGRRHDARLGRLRLFDLIVSGDFDPTLRSGLPGAVRSAIANDPAPLLRLADRADRLESDSVGSFNTAVFAATQCEEGPLPWARSTPAARRIEEARSRLASVPDATLRPFDRATVLFESQPFELCVGWPTAPAAPQFSGNPLPDVPALILAGEDDLRTPLEGAKRVAARMPRASLLTVPDTGHDVLDTEVRGCSRRALRAFFSDRPLKPCLRGRRLFAIEPIAPTSIAQVPPTGGVGGRPGRTAQAVRLTIRDMAIQVAAESLTSGGLTFFSPGIGGLRGGRIVLTTNGIRLARVVYVPGVTVSGSIRFGRVTSGSLRVSGSAAAPGRLRVKADGSLAGRLGGRRVRLEVPNDVVSGGGALLARVRRFSRTLER